jgi:hypothetical protein
MVDGNMIESSQKASKEVKWLLFAVCLMVGLAEFDQNALSAPLPKIASELGSPNDVITGTMAFFFSSASVVLFYGKFSDILGRRFMITCCMGFFIVGSLICALAATMDHLIAGRAIQGLGAGGILTIAQVIVGDTIPDHLRPKFSAVFLSIIGICSVISAPLGAVISEIYSWRAIMAVNIPVGIFLTFIIVSKIQPHSRYGEKSFNILGAILIIVSCACLFISSIFLIDNRIKNIILSSVFGITGILALFFFVFQDRKSRWPLVPPNILKQPILKRCFTLSFLLDTGPILVIGLLPLFLETIHGLSVAWVGFVIAPLPLFMIIGGQIGAKGGDNIMPTFVKVVKNGTLIAAMSYILFAAVIAFERSPLLVSIALGGVGYSIGYVQPALVLTTQQAAPYGLLGTTMGVAGAFRVIAAGVAIAICNLCLAFSLGRGASLSIAAGDVASNIAVTASITITSFLAIASTVLAFLTACKMQRENYEIIPLVK